MRKLSGSRPDFSVPGNPDFPVSINLSILTHIILYFFVLNIPVIFALFLCRFGPDLVVCYA